MRTFIPVDLRFNHVVGAECYFLGPLVLVVRLNEGKTALTQDEYRKIVDYIIAEGFLTDEHKAWLKEVERVIQPVVVTLDDKRLEFDVEANAYLPTY